MTFISLFLNFLGAPSELLMMYSEELLAMVQLAETAEVVVTIKMETETTKCLK